MSKIKEFLKSPIKVLNLFSVVVFCLTTYKEPLFMTVIVIPIVIVFTLIIYFINCVTRDRWLTFKEFWSIF